MTSLITSRRHTLLQGILLFDRQETVFISEPDFVFIYSLFTPPLSVVEEEQRRLVVIFLHLIGDFNSTKEH